MTVLTQIFNILLDSPISFAFAWLFVSIFAWYLYTKIKFEIKKHKNRYYGDSENLSMASASTYLAPRFDPVMNKATSLIIVGGDASYFFLENGDRWAKWLLKNAEAGVRIDYIFTKVEPEEKNKLARKCMNDNMHYHLVDSEKKKLVERFSTYHPVLLNTSDKASRRIWLEKYHPPKSINAEHVSYLTPKSEYFEESFLSLQKEIDFLMKHTSELKLEAA